MYTKSKCHTGDKADITISDLIKRSLLYLLIFFVIGFFLSFAFSLIFFGSEDPNSKINISGYSALFLSVIVTSLLFKKGLYSKKFLGGVFLGTMIFVFTYLISLIIGQNENGITELLFRLSTMIICIIVSILPKLEKSKSKRLKRR